MENAAESVQLAEGTDLQQRENWFTASPDPWREIARLEPGADRTFASVVQQMVLNAEPSQWPALETRLLEALGRRDLSAAGRQFVCRMLGWIGSARCVPEVAKLLQHERSADDARLALDAIDAPAVAEAYRAALPVLRGRAKVGVIGSIAARGDAAALEALTALALNAAEPAEIRAAAERAVERLAARPTAAEGTK